MCKAQLCLLPAFLLSSLLLIFFLHQFSNDFFITLEKEDGEDAHDVDDAKHIIQTEWKREKSLNVGEKKHGSEYGHKGTSKILNMILRGTSSDKQAAKNAEVEDEKRRNEELKSHEQVNFNSIYLNRRQEKDEEEVSQREDSGEEEIIEEKSEFPSITVDDLRRRNDRLKEIIKEFPSITIDDLQRRNDRLKEIIDEKSEFPSITVDDLQRKNDRLKEIIDEKSEFPSITVDDLRRRNDRLKEIIEEKSEFPFITVDALRRRIENSAEKEIIEEKPEFPSITVDDLRGRNDPLWDSAENHRERGLQTA